MSSYTMDLKTYIEMFSQYQNNVSTRDKIEMGRTKLFDFDYPIFDENYRKVFETHFIRNFYTREIGFETEGLFKFQLETWLVINMPYFNKLFESELLSFDPLSNTKVDVSHNKTNGKTQNDTKNSTQNGTTDGTNATNNTENGTGTLTDDNFNRTIDSNNPDTRLALTATDGQGVIEYASAITEHNENNSKSSTNQTSSSSNASTNVSSNVTQDDTLTSSINETEDYLQHRAGKIGVQSFSKMVNEYRDSFIRIERKIFDEMNELFMLVY